MTSTTCHTDSTTPTKVATPTKLYADPMPVGGGDGGLGPEGRRKTFTSPGGTPCSGAISAATPSGSICDSVGIDSSSSSRTTTNIASHASPTLVQPTSGLSSVAATTSSSSCGIDGARGGGGSGGGGTGSGGGAGGGGGCNDEVDVNSDESFEDEDYDEDEDYYKQNDDTLAIFGKTYDPEEFESTVMSEEDVCRLFEDIVRIVLAATKINSASLGKLILHKHNWDVERVVKLYAKDYNKLFLESRVSQNNNQIPCSSTHPATPRSCPICLQVSASFSSVSCGHYFCNNCWTSFCSVKIHEGCTTLLECMSTDCDCLVPEDFVFKLIKDPVTIAKYKHYSFCDYIKTHPQLKFCPGVNCDRIIHAHVDLPKRVICSFCKTHSCFHCGLTYHAPTSCDTIKLWLTKCEDDSETANYISAHTKDCPRCNVCIEKNGGCNHMQCVKCKYNFCWICRGDWKSHGSEYYECSKYKENPNISYESENAQAREALKKYLFYFERWENHSKSLKLEEQTLCKIRDRIQEKVMNNDGTWIDWQYLTNSTSLLKKCRYTLQYTYPYAYFLCSGARKRLFEYQQANLEAEVENLSWKVERAEITDRGDLENQMDIAEKRRVTLLKELDVLCSS